MEASTAFMGMEKLRLFWNIYVDILGSLAFCMLFVRRKMVQKLGVRI